MPEDYGPTLLDPRKRQIFPVYYSGEAQFKLSSEPSGAVGARAVVKIELNNNPQMLTGLRILNIYTIPAELQTVDQLLFLSRLDQQQTVRSDLTEQNIIVRPTSQALVTGGGGTNGVPEHWHPFETPYPVRGGNNLNFEFLRETAYPDEIEAVLVKLAIVGWAYMSDAVPPAGPPSSGYPTSDVGPGR